MNPILIYIFGANAVGKTTGGELLLNNEHINLDEFVLKKINQENPKSISDLKNDPENEVFINNFLNDFESNLPEASTEYFNYCSELIKIKKSFSIEGNTLPGSYSDTKQIITKAKENNYTLSAVFIFTKDIEAIRDRVSVRTINTAQFVPLNLIDQNFKNGIKDLNDLLKIYKSSTWSNIIIYEANFKSNIPVLKIAIENKKIVFLDKEFVKNNSKFLPNLNLLNKEHNNNKGLSM